MSDFHIAHEVKRVETMLKHRGFKVDYTVNGAHQMVVNPIDLGSNSNRAIRFNDLQEVMQWLDGYDYALTYGRELNGVVP